MSVMEPSPYYDNCFCWTWPYGLGSHVAVTYEADRGRLKFRVIPGPNVTQVRINRYTRKTSLDPWVHTRVAARDSPGPNHVIYADQPPGYGSYCISLGGLPNGGPTILCTRQIMVHIDTNADPLIQPCTRPSLCDHHGLYPQLLGDPR